MNDDAQTRLWLVFSVVCVVFLAVGFGYFHLSGGTSKKPPTVATPLLPVVSVCKEVAPGMSRIGARRGDRYMLQFDVPVKSVSVHEGHQDMPPFAYGFDIRLQAGGESYLEISYGPLSDSPDVDRKRAASERIVKRTIVDDQGHSVGEDNWAIWSLNAAGDALDFKDGSKQNMDLSTVRTPISSTRSSSQHASCCPRVRDISSKMIERSA